MLTQKRKTFLMHPVARIAQSVEQRIENPRVPGSIPGSGTILISKDILIVDIFISAFSADLAQ